MIAYKTYLEEKGVNTDDVFDDALVQAKTDLEEALRDQKDLEAQLDEVLVHLFWKLFVAGTLVLRTYK